MYSQGVSSSLPQRALVVGLGGLGCPASLAVARGGVRQLTLLDDDVVDRSNLPRQPWHHLSDIGRPKVESAAEKLRAQFPGLEIIPARERLDAANGSDWFARHDVVLDATDGVDTKFLLSDLAVQTRVPLVYAGVVRLEGAVMRIDPQGPCLRCVFEGPSEDAPTCAQVGVLGSMAGLVGGLQGWLALQPSQAPTGTLHALDGRALGWRRVTMQRRPGCLGCDPEARA